MSEHARIQLSNGGETLVDLSDEARVREYAWFMHRRGGKKLYVRRSTVVSRRSVTYSLHRWLLDAPQGVRVDHVNGNGLDNRRANLRLASDSQNQWNRGLDCRNSSGFKGVSWARANSAWRASIGVRNRRIFLGYFEKIEDAADAYARAAAEYHGEFARTR